MDGLKFAKAKGENMMRKRFFLAVVTAATAVLTACNIGEENTDVDTGSEQGQYRIEIEELKNGEAHISLKKANKGQSVTLTVIPPEAAVPEGEAPVYYFVDKIGGRYSKEEGESPKKFNGFTPGKSQNEWTFKMPDGNLTITITFTDKANVTTADLEWIDASHGTISPEFKKSTLGYTITVPYGATDFSISAQAENPYVTPVLQKNSADSGENLLGETLKLTEGANQYIINVTSQDKSQNKVYKIEVILTPNLALKTLHIKNGTELVRDLPPNVNPQTVYIPHTSGITIFAEADDSNTTLKISPETVSNINATSPKTVTVTVSKSVAGLSNNLENVITLNLYYGANTNPEPLAKGGYISFIPGSDGKVYEVHTFMETDALTFTGATSDITADVVLVAGGGGGGGGNNSTDYPGGGGAGGLVYRTGTIPLSASPIAVMVGVGGAGGQAKSPGLNGGDSSIGELWIAKGGGGGGGGGNDLKAADKINGKAGGSGGGGGGGNMINNGTGGAGFKNSDNTLQGFSGGAGGNSGGRCDSGGGGGGAGKMGTGTGSTNSKNPGVGGLGWSPSGDWAWVKLSTGTNTFANGGDGGCMNYVSTYPNGKAGTNYGDGGWGASKTACTDGNGADGIVIIRFLHPGEGK